MPFADWAPSATLEALRFRAEKIAAVRRFFAEREVLEVDTPVLGQGGSVDPLLDSLELDAHVAGRRQHLWLQTSPEFHMKRLLAAGSGPIFQICHAFRDAEVGQRHNIEFTLLEWYQPGYGLELLREECVELIERILGKPVSLRVRSYRTLFQERLDLDPFTAETAQLAALAADAGKLDSADFSRDDCLDLLFSHVIEPQLGNDSGGAVALLDAVVDYPASQAALAKKRRDPADGCEVAARFELYWQGVELANGYDELANADEQAARFQADSDLREQLGKSPVASDQRLLAALQSGLPACSGVALGLDRLIMLAAGETRLERIMAFPIERA